MIHRTIIILQNVLNQSNAGKVLLSQSTLMDKE